MEADVLNVVLALWLAGFAGLMLWLVSFIGGL
jgi:type IV secretory pathway TrbD component